MDKKKQMRFSEAELGLMKTTFAENEELLKAIRKVFLQIPLDPIDQQLIKGLSKDVLKLINKTFLPTLDGNAPLHQLIDLWMTVEIKDKMLETVVINATAREKLINYLKERLSDLEGDSVEGGISFYELTSLKDKDAEEIAVDIQVRNTIINHTEMQLNQLLVLAGKKEETIDETMKRLEQNSNK